MKNHTNMALGLFLMTATAMMAGCGGDGGETTAGAAGQHSSGQSGETIRSSAPMQLCIVAQAGDKSFSGYVRTEISVKNPKNGKSFYGGTAGTLDDKGTPLCTSDTSWINLDGMDATTDSKDIAVDCKGYPSWNDARENRAPQYQGKAAQVLVDYDRASTPSNPHFLVTVHCNFSDAPKATQLDFSPSMLKVFLKQAWAGQGKSKTAAVYDEASKAKADQQNGSESSAPASAPANAAI